MKLESGVLHGKKIHDVSPNYLIAASTKGVRGRVEFHAVISKSGENVNLCLTRALGGGLDDELARVARQWRYQPYVLHGEPVEVDTIISVMFGTRR